MEGKMIKVISYKGPIKDAPTDYQYWKDQTHEERLAALELLRSQFYDKDTPRLQRVYRIIKQKRS